MRAVERWLDEGWSPWRIGVGTVSLVSLGVTVYGYAVHPHHPGSVWWLLAAALVIAAWSLSEMARWRIRHNRIQVQLQEARRKLENAQRPAVSAPAKPEPSPFELRYYTTVPPDVGRVTSYFVAVKNPPGQPERTARMFVKRMDPLPRQNPPYPGVMPAFPYPVPPASGGSPTIGLTIEPGQEESWRVGNVLIGSDGKISVWRFFRDLDASWELGPGEHWRLYYRIACDGLPDVKFSIVLASEDGQFRFRLEPPAGATADSAG